MCKLIVSARQPCFLRLAKVLCSVYSGPSSKQLSCKPVKLLGPSCHDSLAGLEYYLNCMTIEGCSNAFSYKSVLNLRMRAAVIRQA